MLVYKEWISMKRKSYVREYVWAGLFLFGIIPIFIKRKNYGGRA